MRSLSSQSAVTRGTLSALLEVAIGDEEFHRAAAQYHPWHAERAELARARRARIEFYAFGRPA